MNEIDTIVLSLARTGVIAFVAGIMFWFVFRKFGQGLSPNVHRFTWFGVIVLGLCIFRIGIDLPVLPEVPRQVVTKIEPEFPSEIPATNIVAATPPAILPQQEIVSKPVEISDQKSDRPGISIAKILFAVWIAGIFILGIREIFFIVRIRRLLRCSQPGTMPQWEKLLKHFAIEPSRIPIYWSEKTGPALITGFGDAGLVFPKPLWDELSEIQRDGVLRHELSHFLGRDSFWEFFARIFVLFQWYNPIAWFALARFREATEWKCDDFAYFNRENREQGAKELIETILSVHETTESLGIYLPTFGKSNVLARIDRFVTPPHPGEKTMMKKILVTTLFVVLLFSSVLDFRLVAKPQQEETKTEQKSNPQPGKTRPYRFSEFDPKQVPKIVKMFPANNARNVDPNISQVYLTFDTPMGTGRAWASNNADGTALDHDEDAGGVFWTADKLTCVAPVKLKPNKKYVVYMNISPFIGFASLAGVASEGVTYTFTTGPGPLGPQRREELAKNLHVRPPETPQKKGWSPEQATGKPDAYRMKVGGDYNLAWASQTPDDQKEWLLLTWDEPRECIGVDVYETFNPGALFCVVAYGSDTDGTPVIASWEGIDPTPRDAKNGKGISKIRFDKAVSTNKIRLRLDSPNVPGWNEIDAVALIEPDGSFHWATGAKASSTFADAKTRSRRPFVQPKALIQEEEEEQIAPEPTWAAPEKEELVRGALRKMKDANEYWFRGTPKSEVSSFSYSFHMKGEEPEDISWDDIQKAQSWYTEFYRKGISYIGVSRLLLISIDKLRCTGVEENVEKGTITFDFVLEQEWMNAVGNGISGTWKGWFNGTIGKGTATIDTKTNTLTEIKTPNYDERFFDYVQIKPGQFVPKRIVVEMHNGKRDAKPEMFFDFRFKIYEPGLWLFDKSVPHPSEENPNEPVVWIDHVKINEKDAVEIR